MGGHNVIVVDFNNLYIGRKNFVRKKKNFFGESVGTKLEYAFGGLAELKAVSPGLTLIPIADPMEKEAGKHFKKLCERPIDDEKKLYMAPGPIGLQGVADHFVLALANELDAYILSRDRYRTERENGVYLDSNKIVVPLFIEHQQRWIFVMNHDYRNMLRSSYYHELIRDSDIEIDYNENIGYESVLVKALRSRDGDLFVDLLDELETFSDVTGLSTFDEAFDREVRDCAFNNYLPRIEAEFLGRHSVEQSRVDEKVKSPPLKDRSFAGLAAAIQLKRTSARNSRPVNEQESALPLVPEVVPTPIRKRAEAHFKFFGDGMGELRRRLGRKVIVTGLMRSDGVKLTMGWLDPTIKVEIVNVRSIPDFPSPALVELRGRVCEIDGAVAIEVEEPMEFRFVGLGELISFGQPRREQRVARVSWVLPRFPWSGRFGAVPAPPSVLEPLFDSDQVVEEEAVTRGEASVQSLESAEFPLSIPNPETYMPLHENLPEYVRRSEFATPKGSEGVGSSKVEIETPTVAVRSWRRKLSFATYRLLPVVFWVLLGIVLVVTVLL
jgi:hypothetical protein